MVGRGIEKEGEKSDASGYGKTSAVPEPDPGGLILSSQIIGNHYFN
jgi:hypothetical protein